MMRALFCVLLFLGITGNLAIAQYPPRQTGVGAVNWGDQRVHATGYGAPNPNVPPGAQRAGALEAAKHVALRNLLQTVKGMYLNSETTIENAITTSDIIKSQVQGVVRNFRIIDTRYMSTGDIEVDVEVPLSSLYELLPQLSGGLPENKQQSYAAQASYTKSSSHLNSSHTFQNNVYSGLILDASGLEVRPALSPKILDESGQEVYGSAQVSREYAVQIGVIGYEKNLERAKTNERVSGNPLIIKALKASGQNKTDIVIRNSDAQLIKDTAVNLNFLELCKVMVVLN